MDKEKMVEPERPADEPSVIQVEAGQKYFWCACGKSKKQPFCDGAHSGTGISPVVYKADENKKVFFCNCKQTVNAPLCDGSHSRS
jgi:CDGSH-type Zn-finger protein